MRKIVNKTELMSVLIKLTVYGRTWGLKGRMSSEHREKSSKQDRTNVCPCKAYSLWENMRIKGKNVLWVLWYKIWKFSNVNNNSWHWLTIYHMPGTVLNILRTFFHLVIKTNQWKRCCYCHHYFKDCELKAWRF